MLNKVRIIIYHPTPLDPYLELSDPSKN